MCTFVFVFMLVFASVCVILGGRKEERGSKGKQMCWAFNPKGKAHQYSDSNLLISSALHRSLFCDMLILFSTSSCKLIHTFIHTARTHSYKHKSPRLANQAYIVCHRSQRRAQYVLNLVIICLADSSLVLFFFFSLSYFYISIYIYHP